MTLERTTPVAHLASRIPPSFTLGVAAAAFQIEGALADGGRGPSGWDAFAEKPGAIEAGASPEVTCDHYHRLPEDVALLQDLGVDSYRFSLSWPRIQPEGRGAVNQAGLDFYDRLIDSLLAVGITPMATLYHWDTPLPLEHRGGWLSRETAKRFGDYAYAAGTRFGDRVSQWVTLNEPLSVAFNGYAFGVHAPGRALLFDALPAIHHQLLAHGLGVQALRAASVVGGIGLTNFHAPIEPASNTRRDRLVAHVYDLAMNRMYADPVLLGRYPRLPLWAQPWLRAKARITDADLQTIHQPLDFYGLNYYFPVKVAMGRGKELRRTDPHHAMSKLPFRTVDYPELARTGFGWPVAPDHLGTVLGQLRDRYGAALPPVYITEGGASFPEPDSVSAPLHDAERQQYLADHLGSALAAVAPGGVAEGVDLRGYYVWTLMDNFEWAAGYTQRFGLVHVDFATQARTPKQSYYWFRDLIRSREP